MLISQQFRSVNPKTSYSNQRFIDKLIFFELVEKSKIIIVLDCSRTIIGFWVHGLPSLYSLIISNSKVNAHEKVRTPVCRTQKKTL